MDTYIFIGLFISVIALSFIVGYFNQQRITRAWQELAQRTGLTCEVNYVLGLPRPRVVGTYRGHMLSMERYSTGSGRHRQNYTRLILTVRNPDKAALTLYEQTIFGEIGKALGMQDIQTGDAELDRRLVIKSDSPAFAAAVLSATALRQKLLAAQSYNIQLKGPQMRLLARGVITDVERLQALFDLASELAAGVERAS